MIRQFIAIGFLTILMGCASVAPSKVVVEQRTQLDTPVAAPLQLYTYHLIVIEINGKRFIAVSEEDYVKLAEDMQLIQNRLQTDETVIAAQKQYYGK